MPEYNTLRTIDGAQSLISGLILLVIGLGLLHRGYAERSQWVRQVPGRIVLGAFLTLTALIYIEAAAAKLLFRQSGVGGVGPYINNWWVNCALFVSLLLGIWSIYRLFRNTLGAGDAIKPDERTANATERLADQMEMLVERTTE